MDDKVLLIMLMMHKLGVSEMRFTEKDIDDVVMSGYAVSTMMLFDPCAFILKISPVPPVSKPPLESS